MKASDSCLKCGPKEGRWDKIDFCRVDPSEAESRLTTETVESTALALECVDDIHGGDGLSLGVLAVGDGVTDHVLEEDLEDT